MNSPEFAQQAQPETDIGPLMREIDDFIRYESPTFGKLFGLSGIDVRVGNAWAMDLKNGQITINPETFLKQDSGADDAASSITHELIHLSDRIREPEIMRQYLYFINSDQSNDVFGNTFMDIHDNNIKHALLPRMKGVDEKLYRDDLFSDDDYTDKPRHYQFLYKIIKEEMVPGDNTKVNPEVSELIASFRDFKNSGHDLIKYSTQHAKSPTEQMPLGEKYDYWTKIIYPEWKNLLEMDKQDPKFQKQPSGNNDQDSKGSESSGEQNAEAQGSNNEQGGEKSELSGEQNYEETESSDEQNGKQNSSPTEHDSGDETAGGQNGQTPDTPSEHGGDSGGEADFSAFYEEFKQIFPDMITDEEQAQIDREITDYNRQQAAEKRKVAAEDRRNSNPKQRQAEQFKRETGYDIVDLQKYNSEVERWRDSIDALRDILRKTLNEHIGSRRRLTGNHEEGAVLTPEHLARTAVDIQLDRDSSPAFSDYERRLSEHELTGKADFVFAFDCSGSMQGDRARAAASSAVICIEALSGMQRDIEEAEQRAGFDIDVDIRTALYTFGDSYNVPKPLSYNLTTKERLDAYSEITFPESSQTSGAFFGEVAKIPPDNERRQVLVVITDGEFNTDLDHEVVRGLISNGWVCYCVGIGNQAKIDIFGSNGSRITDPSLLPQKIEELIERNI